MKTVFACLIALGPILTAGCASGGRAGVIDRLPLPIAKVGSPRRNRIPPEYVPAPVRKPARRLAAPTTFGRWYPRQGISGRWTHIVLHHSGGNSGNARQFDQYHRNVNGWDELGYHFVIGNGTSSGDGEIEVGSRWWKQKHGAHCKTPDNRYNDHGIGICLVGDFRHHPPSPAQMASLSLLTQFLMRECDIDVQHVVTHGGVTGKTACPGGQFPLWALRRSLASYSRAGVMP